MGLQFAGLPAGILLAEAKGLAGCEAMGYVALAAATVAVSWFLVHTLLAVHYTHMSGAFNTVILAFSINLATTLL